MKVAEEDVERCEAVDELESRWFGKEMKRRCEGIQNWVGRQDNL